MKVQKNEMEALRLRIEIDKIKALMVSNEKKELFENIGHEENTESSMTIWARLVSRTKSTLNTQGRKHCILTPILQGKL